MLNASFSRTSSTSVCWISWGLCSTRYIVLRFPSMSQVPSDGCSLPFLVSAEFDSAEDARCCEIEHSSAPSAPDCQLSPLVSQDATAPICPFCIRLGTHRVLIELRWQK